MIRQAWSERQGKVRKVDYQLKFIRESQPMATTARTRRWTMGAIATAMLCAAGMGDSANEAGAAAAARIDWSHCGKRLECAQVRVPLDWDRPNAGKISLKVVRHLASRPEQRIGSLLSTLAVLVSRGPPR